MRESILPITRRVIETASLLHLGSKGSPKFLEYLSERAIHCGPGRPCEFICPYLPSQVTDFTR